MRHAIIIEKANQTFSAYLPAMPGCVATGATVAEAEAETGEAIRLQIQDLMEDGLRVPEPTAIAEYIEA